MEENVALKLLDGKDKINISIVGAYFDELVNHMVFDEKIIFPVEIEGDDIYLKLRRKIYGAHVSCVKPDVNHNVFQENARIVAGRFKWKEESICWASSDNYGKKVDMIAFQLFGQEIYHLDLFNICKFIRDRFHIVPKLNFGYSNMSFPDLVKVDYSSGEFSKIK